ncbi:MAG: PilZ domain-containing protein [Desulfobacterales bacterium]|nr:PilZ domain-containing protein [Desulfobacterales bacterium]
MVNSYNENNINPGRRSGQDRRVLSDPSYQGPERRVAVRRSGTEIRRHNRYRVKDHIYVNLRSESGEEVGQLLDISKGGLSLQFLATDENSKTYTDLGILASMDLAMEKIPFRTVSVEEVDNDIPLSITRLRRYSLEFKNLTPAQRAKLDFFIKNYTYGNA